MNVRLLGKFLHISDKLNNCYNKYFLNQNKSQQLIGYETMRELFTGNVIQSLTRLELSLSKYIHWAENYNDGEDIKLVKYFLKHAKTLSSEMMFENRILTPIEKVELLFGYISGLEKSNDDNTISN